MAASSRTSCLASRSDKTARSWLSSALMTAGMSIGVVSTALVVGAVAGCCAKTARANAPAVMSAAATAANLNLLPILTYPSENGLEEPNGLPHYCFIGLLETHCNVTERPSSLPYFISPASRAGFEQSRIYFKIVLEMFGGGRIL